MIMDYRKVSGKRIKVLRVEADLKQSELAEMVGLTQVAVSMYENGNWNLRADVAIKLAAVLNTDAAYLMALDAAQPQPELA